ncbi:hypothetical protein ACN28I_33200 [Archangium gephyra]|uniref:hypothetical protein n=1 Tax=Archangium gephyra TaxID=48 RepID=UPI003B7BA069
MRVDSTSSPRRVIWRRSGPRVLGIALLLLLGGCATRAPLAGLLPGVHKPHRRAPPPPASAQASTAAGGAYAAPRPASP